MWKNHNFSRGQYFKSKCIQTPRNKRLYVQEEETHSKKQKKIGIYVIQPKKGPIYVGKSNDIDARIKHCVALQSIKGDRIV